MGRACVVCLMSLGGSDSKRGRVNRSERWKDKEPRRAFSPCVYGNTRACVQQLHCSQWEGHGGGRVNPSSAAGRGCFELLH